MLKKSLILLLFFGLISSAALARWDLLSTSVTNNLNAAFFTSSTEGFVVGAGGTVLRTISGGSNFTLQTAFGSDNYNDVIFPTTLEGYLLGNNGQLWKTLDGGTNFTKILLPAGLTAADFQKGAFFGTNRSIAVFNSGTSQSYLYESADSGATFASTLIPNYTIAGVVLISGESLVWGYNTVTSKESILLNGTIEVWTGSQVINDIFFVNNLFGYAVGSNGLMLKTTDGGHTWPTVLNTGVTNSLRAVYFLSSDTGWVIGDGNASGTILFTNDQGNTFVPYVDSLIDPNLRDIYALVENTTASQERPVVHAYIAAAAGKVYKLSSPIINTVTPTAEMQGWVGYVTVEGTGFMSGVAMAIGGTQILSVTSMESSTRLRSVVLIGSQASTEARDVAVENIDKTYGSKTKAFTVTPNPNLVKISNIWFLNQGVSQWNKYQIPFQSISPTPAISFEVETSSLTAIVSKETLNTKILFFQDGFYKNIIFVPSSLISFESSSGQKKATISFTMPQVLAAGPGSLEIYAEDSDGDVGRLPISVEVSSSSQDVPTPSGSLEGAGSNDIAAGYVIGSVWDPAVGAVTIQFRFKPGIYLPAGYDLVILTGPGGDVAFKKHYYMPTLNAAAVSSTGMWQNIQISQNDIGHPYLRNGMAVWLLIDSKTNTIRARGKFVINAM